METEIQTQHIHMEPEWRALIDARLARLDEHFGRLIRVHVTLRHGGHHLHGTEEVAIVASFPGATVRAAKQKADMRDAVHAAFEAVEHALTAHHDKRREFETPRS